jgi:IS605 OrfB family transposase
MPIARAHARARHVRRDAVHKLTTELTAGYGTIVVEKLNAHGLCRGGNRGLRRALHDAGLAEIRRQLAYKLAWRGGTLIQASTFYPSSKTCSACGTVKAKLSLSAGRITASIAGSRSTATCTPLTTSQHLPSVSPRVAGRPQTRGRAHPPVGVPRTRVRPGQPGQWVDREARTASRRVRRAPL